MFKISFNSNPKNLRVVRAAVRGFLHVAGYKKSDSQMIVLAIDEAICNIIKYSYDNKYDEIIDLEMKEEQGQLYFMLRDYGKKGDPDSFASRKLEDVRPGGLGVFLMKKIMDDVSYDVSVNVGTELMMRKSK